MPITKLDATAALIVVDLQKGIVGMPTVHPIADVVERSARLAGRARQRDRPGARPHGCGTAGVCLSA
jgi:Isochorismatase family